MADPNAFPDFVWSIGEEGSDPIVMRQGERYRQDQFAESGHDEHMEDDLVAIADLGVQVVRYGTPWRLAEPEPGVYDWSLWDRAFAACAAAGLEPIVEFLHFGLPDHHPGFVDRAWIDSFVRYVTAFLDRYPAPRWFTPINEPGITARLSARFGIWNDMAATSEAHAQALANIVQANLEAMALIRTDRNGWWVGSEGFDIPVAMNDSRRQRRMSTAFARSVGSSGTFTSVTNQPSPATSMASTRLNLRASDRWLNTTASSPGSTSTRSQSCRSEVTGRHGRRVN